MFSHTVRKDAMHELSPRPGKERPLLEALRSQLTVRNHGGTLHRSGSAGSHCCAQPKNLRSAQSSHTCRLFWMGVPVRMMRRWQLREVKAEMVLLPCADLSLQAGRQLELV
jgi:hypothetical protein